MESLTKVQVGGTHYKGMVYQPFEIAHANAYDAATFSILKYVMRHAEKGGRQDLEKAIHIVNIRVDLLAKYGQRYNALNTLLPDTFCTANNTPYAESMILHTLHEWARFPGETDFAKLVLIALAHLIRVEYLEGN